MADAPPPADGPDLLFERYREMQRYVGWSADDAVRVARLRPLVEPAFTEIIDDFYREVGLHEGTRRVLGGVDLNRLRGTLRGWLTELLSGCYDRDYVVRRRRVGRRHVEIGLEPVFMNVAMGRLRRSLVHQVDQRWPDGGEERAANLRSLHTLLDLDLAIIEDAYQAEHLARLQRHERLAAIGQVAGGVAHELRNPLNVVKTSVYYLLHARTLTAEKRDEYLQRIERHVTLADGIITTLTNFARLPVPARQAFVALHCVQEALEANPVGPGIEVVFDFPADLPAALADPDQVRIVLANLIRNAREAMSAGGQLRLSGTAVEGRLELAVADTGIGISPERLEHVLEPLYSTKARGLGLGLAIARAILEKNQGGLRVTSTLGVGSTFTLTLPATRGEGPTLSIAVQE